MTDPLKVCIANPQFESTSACTYYRIDIPAVQMRELYGAKVFRVLPHMEQELNLKAKVSADVTMWYNLIGEGVLDNVRTIKDMKAEELDGVLRFPPATIWDSDDNTDYVHPVNTSFAVHGVRGYPSNELLRPGEQLHLEDETGNVFQAWVDLETLNDDGLLFDIERNLHLMKLRHQIVREVHGVTTPSTVLASYFRDVIGQKNVHVFPNTILPNDYPGFDLIPSKEIRILWQGGMSHYIDWYPLRYAIREVSDKYPHVKWVVFGEDFKFHNILPPERVERVAWVPYSAYRIRRGLMQAQINLCPLSDNVFNRCKSAIKWYEASIIRDPEATLASRVPPFSLEMTDGVNGLLYSTPEEFVQKLSLLIEDEQLRKTLGANAKQWVLDNRTPEKTLPPLHDFYQECRRIRVREALDRPVTDREFKKIVANAR